VIYYSTELMVDLHLWEISNNSNK